MTNHETIIAEMETYIAENEKLTTGKIKASAARARKALQTIAVAIKARRKEIMEEKNAI